jgi:hypothetical protein
LLSILGFRRENSNEKREKASIKSQKNNKEKAKKGIIYNLFRKHQRIKILNLNVKMLREMLFQT